MAEGFLLFSDPWVLVDFLVCGGFVAKQIAVLCFILGFWRSEIIVVIGVVIDVDWFEVIWMRKVVFELKNNPLNIQYIS